MSNKKILITGFGAITAAGNTIEKTFEAIKSGQTYINKITHWDASNWEYSLGAEIEDYDPRSLFPDRKLLKLLSRQDVLGLNAAIQAVEHSDLLTFRQSLSNAESFNERTGIFVGSPGNKFYQQYDYLPLLSKTSTDLKAFAEGLEESVHPMWLLKVLPNNVLAYTGIRYEFKGANQNITNHAISGTQAIIEASHAIQSGIIDRAVVVAYDYGLAPQELMYYYGAGLLSKSGVYSFDIGRDGTILGEGAGALILESQESAMMRNALVYGELLGGATNSENGNILSQDISGSGLSNAILNTLDKANISPSDIGMITAHANGTRISDASEANAILNCFKHKVPVTGFKWAIGHTLSAAGVIEFILTLLSLREQRAPGICTIKQKDPLFEDVEVSTSSKMLSSKIGLLATRAFYSLNSCLLLKAL